MTSTTLAAHFGSLVAHFGSLRHSVTPTQRRCRSTISQREKKHLINVMRKSREKSPTMPDGSCRCCHDKRKTLNEDGKPVGRAKTKCIESSSCIGFDFHIAGKQDLYGNLIAPLVAAAAAPAAPPPSAAPGSAAAGSRELQQERRRPVHVDVVNGARPRPRDRQAPLPRLPRRRRPPAPSSRWHRPPRQRKLSM